MAKGQMSKEEIMAKINKPHDDKLSIERDERCIPMAIEILKKVVEHPDLGSAIGFIAKPESHKSVSKDMQLEMIELFLKNGIKIRDTGYIFRLQQSIVDLLQEIMRLNIDENLQRAEDHLWGMKHGEVSFVDLHKVLEQSVEEASVAKESEEVQPELDKQEEVVAEPEKAVEEPIDEPQQETV